MPKLSLCLALIMSLGCYAAYGQQQAREVRGVVQDSTGTPLVGVTVRLYAPADTMMVSTNDQGRFVFGRVAANRFRLTFSLIGFQIFERFYESDVLLPITELVTVNLKEQSQELQEIAVYGTVPVQLKEDTVQYNTAAFSIRSGALLEELVKQFPGIEVNRNGEIRTQGQYINRVRVNGKDFFDGDVLTATRNLPAEIVENVQVIDDYGDEANITGVRTGEPEKVLNINIKEDRNKGAFGQVTAGGGSDVRMDPDARYLGSFAANKFDGNKQLSLLGSINNTNTSLFSFGDITGAGSRNGPDINNMIDAGDGINLTKSIGVNYRDEIANGVTTYGGYTYTERNNRTIGTTGLQSIYLLRSIVTEEEVNSVSENTKHKLSWTIEANLDSVNYLKITPSASYALTNLNNRSHSAITNNLVHTNRRFNTLGRNSNPYFDLDVFYNHRFKKNRRNFSLSVASSYLRHTRKDEITDFTFVMDSVSRFFQNLNNFSLNHSVSLRASYIEPIKKNSLLEFSYQFDYNAIKNERGTFNVDTIDRSEELIDSLSINYSYLFQTSQLGLNFQSKVKGFKYTLGFAIQPTELDGRVLTGDINTNLRRINFIPTASLQFKINQLSNLSLSYRGQNNQPAFTQIQPVRDVSNQQYVVNGNAELKPEFMNTLNLQYRHFGIQSGSSFFSHLAFTHIKDKVVTNRFSASNSTRQETAYLNADGFFDVRAYYSFSTPIAGKVLTLNLSGDADYTHDIALINNLRNVGKRWILSQNAQLSFQIEDFLEADLRGTYLLNHVGYSIPAFLDAQANSVSLGFGGKGYFSKRWMLSFDFSQQFNNGFSNYVQANPTLLNVYIERTFLRNDMAAIRLQGFDLFNQNTGVSRDIRGNDIFDVRNNRLSRYLMLSLNLRLQRFPNSK